MLNDCRIRHGRFCGGAVPGRGLTRKASKIAGTLLSSGFVICILRRLLILFNGFIGPSAPVLRLAVPRLAVPCLAAHSPGAVP